MKVLPMLLKEKWNNPATNPLVLYVFGDTHIGNKMTRIDLLKKHVSMCKKEKAYWIHLGDIIDAITIKDRRANLQEMDDLRRSVLEQYYTAKELFYPIKDRCLGILSGNHEKKLVESNIGDFGQLLATELTANYLGYMGYLNLPTHCITTHNPLHVFCWHGHGGGELLGSKALKIQRLGAKFLANIYLVGHWHTYLAHSDEYLSPMRQGNKHYIARNTRWYFACPSYLDGYNEDVDVNYIKTVGYPPQPQGCLKLSITSNKTTSQEQLNYGWNVVPEVLK